MNRADSKAIQQPRVSVVIPAYNAVRYLREALESVLNQTYSPIEVVLVNDGSTDATAEAVAPFLSRIRYHVQANAGLAAARNAGLKIATGDYVALMDADDIADPDRVRWQVAVMEQWPELVLCSSDFSAYDGGRVTVPAYAQTYYRSLQNVQGDLAALYSSHHELSAPSVHGASRSETTTVYAGHVHENLLWGNFIHPPTVMFRRTALEAVGGFDERIVNGCDYDWFVRLSRTGPFGFIDRPLLNYRLSPNQMSSDKHVATIMLDTIEIMKKVVDAEPHLAERHRDRLRQRVGQCYLSAANATVESDKRRAFGFLLASLKQGFFRLSMLLVTGKLLLPRWLLALKRSAQRKFDK
jgi:glycosyltransferase involved in cell wall biosynthesis